MRNSITDVPGITVGHAQDEKAGTGCTVILCETAVAGGVDVRGGAPGTQETECLDPENIIPAMHAVYLAGGSAFGLDGASGVRSFLERRKIGFDVGVTRVPIVCGAVIFDLAVGSPFVRPDAAMGARACAGAGLEVAQGNVGAGTGAIVGKAAGNARAMKGGLGTASVSAGDLVVGAIVVVNSLGDVVDPDTAETLAGALTDGRDGFAGSLELLSRGPRALDVFTANTTIGAVATNARLDKAGARRVAMMAHDGLARAIVPVHTLADGDTIFSISMGPVEADVTVTGALAARAMALAVTSAIRNAASAYGFPGCCEMRERLGRPPL
jgi:L-aminopeptidase/D-esterase-like protein